MSAEVRKRIATRGFRGATLNRRTSVATFGFHPIGFIDLSQYWRDSKNFTLNIQQVFHLTFEK